MSDGVSFLVPVDADALRVLCGELTHLRKQRDELQARMSQMVIRRQRIREDIRRIDDALEDGFATRETAFDELRASILAELDDEVLGQ